MKNYINTSIYIKDENICKIINKKCIKKNTCKNCEIYYNYIKQGRKI
jgi:hypothetical protein